MSRCIQERADVVLRRTRRFLNTEGKNFKQRIRKMMDEEEKKRLTPDEWSNLKQLLTQKVLPILNTMSQMEKDMKWLEKYPLGHHPLNGAVPKKKEVLKSRKRNVVSEEVRDELGDDYQEVRPSPHQGWRQYLARGRNSHYFPKDTITLIWKYKSSDSAKRKKEEELKKKFPNKQFTWMDFPNISLSILGID